MQKTYPGSGALILSMVVLLVMSLVNVGLMAG